MMGVYQAVCTYFLLMAMYCGADVIKLEKSKEMPKENESFTLSCFINESSIITKIGFTPPNNNDIFPLCITTVEKCTRYYEIHQSLIDPKKVNMEIKSLSKQRDEGYWECWYTIKEETFKAGLDLTVYTAGEEKDQSGRVVVTIPVIITIGVAPAVFCVTIISIGIALNKRRQSPAIHHNGNMYEGDEAHGNDLRRYETRRPDNNYTSNEYESLIGDVDEDIQTIRMQSVSESHHDMDTRSETVIKDIWTDGNNDSPNDHEGLRGNVDEDIRFDGMQNISESSQETDARYKSIVSE